MRHIRPVSSLLVLTVAALTVGCRSTPRREPSPETTAERVGAFLDQLEGTWDFELEAIVEEDEPPATGEGRETVSRLGRWAVLEGHVADARSRLTVGFDERRGECIAFWVHSEAPDAWEYVGTLDESGRTLTLAAEGPNPSHPGRVFRYRDIYRITGPGRRELESEIYLDGAWESYFIARYRRVVD